MLGNHTTLPHSRDVNGFTETCMRCDMSKPKSDGVYFGTGRWVCGKCWRMKATRQAGAAASLAREGKAKA